MTVIWFGNFDWSLFTLNRNMNLNCCTNKRGAFWHLSCHKLKMESQHLSCFSSAPCWTEEHTQALVLKNNATFAAWHETDPHMPKTASPLGECSANRSPDRSHPCFSWVTSVTNELKIGSLSFSYVKLYYVAKNSIKRASTHVYRSEHECFNFSQKPDCMHYTVFVCPNEANIKIKMTVSLGGTHNLYHQNQMEWKPLQFGAQSFKGRTAENWAM